jgi:hypothetical protein
MRLQTRDKRALLLLAVCAIVFVIFWSFSGSSEQPVVVASAVDSVPLAEKRLERIRSAAAAVPGRENLLKQVSAELATRETGIIQADTASQAQAQLVQVLRRVAKAQMPPLDIRSVEIGQLKALGNDYGEAMVTVSIDCHIDELVNLLAALTQQKELIATSEIRIGTANPKDKILPVRLTVSGVVARKLVPEKKGVSVF